ncbi:unnamed protein product [Calicophoron daubneyi]|uniref:PLAC8 family protein n=1 Tax=Calicophoron daubneyi TaxID=300641 RepID=A0AAV2TEY7_CALDB
MQFQPVAQPATVVIATQPTALPVLTQKDWSDGLFDVPDFCLFLLSCLCPCAVFASTAEEIGHSYACCFILHFFTLLACFPAHIVLGCLFRERVRNRYGIRGNVCFDLLAYTCCYACTLNQEALQADHEKRARASTIAVTVAPTATTTATGVTPQAVQTNENAGVSIRLGRRVFNIGTQRLPAGQQDSCQSVQNPNVQQTQYANAPLLAAATTTTTPAQVTVVTEQRPHTLYSPVAPPSPSEVVKQQIIVTTQVPQVA